MALAWNSWLCKWLCMNSCVLQHQIFQEFNRQTCEYVWRYRMIVISFFSSIRNFQCAEMEWRNHSIHFEWKTQQWVPSHINQLLGTIVTRQKCLSSDCVHLNSYVNFDSRAQAMNGQVGKFPPTSHASEFCDGNWVLQGVHAVHGCTWLCQLGNGAINSCSLQTSPRQLQDKCIGLWRHMLWTLPQCLLIVV